MKLETIFEWSATVILIIGVILSSWNIFPYNIFFSLVGNFFWLILGFMWKKNSLILIQGLIVVIYIFGTINYLLTY